MLHRADAAWIRGNPLVRKAVLATLVVVLFIPSLVLYVARLMFLRVNGLGRIGHLAAESDTFIKEGLLGLRGRYHGVILSPAGDASNE